MATRERSARWLIPFPILAKALVWAGNEEELAAELWVDVHTVRTRLATLTPDESSELARLMEEAELCSPRGFG